MVAKFIIVYMFPFEVRSDAEEIVERGIDLLWLLGVLCEVCTETTETAEQRRSRPALGPTQPPVKWMRVFQRAAWACC